MSRIQDVGVDPHLLREEVVSGHGIAMAGHASIA